MSILSKQQHRHHFSSFHLNGENVEAIARCLITYHLSNGHQVFFKLDQQIIVPTQAANEKNTFCD